MQVQIIGKVLDSNYARKLAQMPDLSLGEIIILDKIIKNKDLNDAEIKLLRSKKLIEGRKPNFHISSAVANVAGEKGSYIKLKGFDEDYYIDLIIKYLKEFEKARKADISELLLGKLPSVLTTDQKENRIKNLLQKMKKEKQIKVDDQRYWVLDEIRRDLDEI